MLEFSHKTRYHSGFRLFFADNDVEDTETKQNAIEK